MAWIEPKTNWTKKDYFNAEDYNRMIGNLLVLKEMADELFIGIVFTDMGEEKPTDGNSFIYAREFSAIENNLSSLNNSSYGINTSFRHYVDNGLVPSYEDYNRIESMMLLLYEKMKNHKKNLYRLPFRLGNQKGVRV